MGHHAVWYTGMVLIYWTTSYKQPEDSNPHTSNWLTYK